MKKTLSCVVVISLLLAACALVSTVYSSPAEEPSALYQVIFAAILDPAF